MKNCFNVGDRVFVYPKCRCSECMKSLSITRGVVAAVFESHLVVRQNAGVVKVHVERVELDLGSELLKAGERNHGA